VGVSVFVLGLVLVWYLRFDLNDMYAVADTLNAPGQTDLGGRLCLCPENGKLRRQVWLLNKRCNSCSSMRAVLVGGGAQ
jgi:hypothetical protein